MDRVIHKIFKKVESSKDRRLSGEVKLWMNSVLMSIVQRFVHGSITMLECRQQRTLTDDDIRAIASMIYIGEVAVRAVQYADTVGSTSDRGKGILFITPARARSMLLDGVATYKIKKYEKGFRVGPLVPVVLAAVLQYVIEEVFRCTCVHMNLNPEKKTVYLQDVLAAVNQHKPLYQTLCASGLLSL